MQTAIERELPIECAAPLKKRLDQRRRRHFNRTPGEGVAVRILCFGQRWRCVPLPGTAGRATSKLGIGCSFESPESEVHDACG